MYSTPSIQPLLVAFQLLAHEFSMDRLQSSVSGVKQVRRIALIRPIVGIFIQGASWWHEVRAHDEGQTRCEKKKRK